MAGLEDDYHTDMSVTELLKHVKALSTRERQRFVLEVISLELEADHTTVRGPRRSLKKAGRAKWPDVEARARRIFGNRVLPNLVLLERDEAPF